MAFKLNAVTGVLDLVGLTASSTGIFVRIIGDTMTGDLVFPVTGFVMVDSGGTQWRVTIDTLGSIVTTAIAPPVASYYLMENGTDKYLLEDSSGDYILE